MILKDDPETTAMVSPMMDPGDQEGTRHGGTVMKRFGIAVVLTSLSLVFLPAGPAWAGYKVEINEHAELGVGFWMKGWYQWVENGKNDLTLNGVAGRDNLVWTVDSFFDHPVGNGAFTMEGAYIDIANGTTTQPQMYTDLAAGDDARTWYVNLGYLLNGIGPGGLQPYCRYEQIEVDHKGRTRFISGGLNYYLNGHNAKITLDYMYVDPTGVTQEDRSIFTAQVAVGL